MRRKTNCQTLIHLFRKALFQHVLNVRKTNSIVKFDGLEARHREHIKEIMALEINPNSFGTFEKQGPFLENFSGPKSHS